MMIASIDGHTRKVCRRDGAIDYAFYQRRVQRLRVLALLRLIKRFRTAVRSFRARGAVQAPAMAQQVSLRSG